MTPNFDQREAEKWIVQVCGPQDMWARGFITRSGKVVTAAHCLPSFPDNDPLNAPETEVTIRNRQGAYEKKHVIFVDPCQDLAVMDRVMVDDPDQDLDLLRYIRNPRTLEQDCEAEVEGLHIDLEIYPTSVAKIIDVFIFTHDEKWIVGKGTFDFDSSTRMHIELNNSEDRIYPGTSGSPVFSSNGQVVAIVTNNSRFPEATSTWLANTLPRWLVTEEREATDEDQC